MKKLFIGLLTLGSLSTFAAGTQFSCSPNSSPNLTIMVGIDGSVFISEEISGLRQDASLDYNVSPNKDSIKVTKIDTGNEFISIDLNSEKSTERDYLSQGKPTGRKYKERTFSGKIFSDGQKLGMTCY